MAESVETNEFPPENPPPPKAVVARNEMSIFHLVNRCNNWFAANQNADGSWGEGDAKITCTALVLTAQLASNWYSSNSMYENDNLEQLQFSTGYLVDAVDAKVATGFAGFIECEMPIAAWCFSEIYGYFRVPMLRLSRNPLLEEIFKTQQDNGLWKRKPGDSQTDIVYSGWCIRALASVDYWDEDSALTNRIDVAKSKAGDGLKTLAREQLRAEKIPGEAAITLYCLTLLDVAGSDEAKEIRRRFADATLDFENAVYAGNSPFLYVSYIAANKHLYGGREWGNWNNEFCLYLTTQYHSATRTNETAKIEQLCWFESPSPNEQRGVGGAGVSAQIYDTCMMLIAMPPWRRLPTFKNATVDENTESQKSDANEIPIEIIF